MGKSFRAERMAGEIKKVVSELLIRELKDPRFSGMVSVSGVKVSKDCSHAAVYISVMESDDKEEVLEAFDSAKGLIRKEIGRQIKTRHVPELNFRLDTSLEYSQHISSILEGLNLNTDKTEENSEEDAEFEE